MAIEVVPEQLHALAGALDAASTSAARAAAALATDPVGGPVGEAVAAFCEGTGAAGRCLAGELGWLGRAVAAAADSWLGLDAGLLPVPGRGVAG
ncbi:Flp pilus assembly protein TadG [Modestobacter versicolor]|uniref:Flp pilus assembly protein TadG n=1 Tax=Modestobacter versicolor TaxID=429133 RepID=A0A839Y9M5_9ACTN|nr:hypothetical protein [Modestobacter versicolor]MBB3678032.1 Flp pilus assembly protein TadG [Modestobacter versicolor]